jgi:hypothetical protein
MARAAVADAAAAAQPEAPAEPTLEQYRLAYRELRRPGWPPFEWCMQDHVRRICLAGIARNRSRVRWAAAPVAPSLPQGQPVPPTPDDAPGRTFHRPRTELGAWPARRGGHDAKRLAANDKD